MSSGNVCLYNKFGFCKHGNCCWKMHIQEKCEIPECDASQCDKRHPQECRYYQSYKRCKFGQYCSYNHLVHTDPVLEELKLVKEKLKVLEKDIESKNLEIMQILLRLEKALKSSEPEILPISTNSLAPVTCSSSMPLSTLTTIVNSSDTYDHQDQSSLRGEQIPQLDGMQEHPQPVHQVSCWQCENCGKAFESEEHLNNHTEIHGWGCDECLICYTSKYLVDLHELEMHPGTSYARDHIPEATKIQFAARNRNR